MTCSNCGDKGLTRLVWCDAPDDYAVCLCDTGLRLRATRNHGHAVAPLWHVWCAREQVGPERVWLLEDVLTPVELEARGLAVPAPRQGREAALLAAGKRTR